MYMNITIENVSSGTERVVVLPMDSNDLFEVVADLLGRDSGGYLLANQGYRILDSNGVSYKCVYKLNAKLGRGQCVAPLST